MALSQLANPLATVEQLSSSGSQLDGIPADLEDSVRFAGAKLTQAAGILLRLPQEIIAQAVVTFTRFFAGPEGGSLAQYGAEQISASSLYLAAKLSAYPKSPRSVINIYAYISSLGNLNFDPSDLDANKAEAYYVSEGTYQAQRVLLTRHETQILKVLGFQLHVALPYTLCISYLQALDVFSHPRRSELVKRAFAYLNTALLSSQLLYLTHQPPSVATAAIYLAAKEVGVHLPACEWWEVFDTDREELGFLVMSLLSVDGFARAEGEKWGRRGVPMTVEDVESEIKNRKLLNGGG